jgi:hypothetical protein
MIERLLPKNEISAWQPLFFVRWMRKSGFLSPIFMYKKAILPQTTHSCTGVVGIKRGVVGIAKGIDQNKLRYSFGGIGGWQNGEKRAAW